MKAGKYYIGDLCYVMHDAWDEVCALTFQKPEGVYGEFTLKDGRQIAIYSTAYGDGAYPTSTNALLSVDSGTIGCILMSDIRDDTYTHDEILMMAEVITFETDFDTSCFGANINFGHVTVETGYNEEEEDYYEDEDEEEY